jgi:precorrin-4/cobalt-precorrin-4 C11-methyltransferase
MVHFVGAGPGAPDLITLRGAALLERADQVIYAGSLVNPALLSRCRADCVLRNSAEMTLEQVLAAIESAEAAGKTTVRLHTGDPCLYGAIREQMDELDRRGIPYDYCPGVSAFSGAAAALKMEYTLPEVSQSVIITRMAGRTPVPERESVRAFAAHGATMVLFLSAGLLEATQGELLAGGYSPDTPAAIVYKASWPDEKTCLCTVSTLAACARENGISKIALIIVGEAVKQSGYARSKLYDPTFATAYRPAKE